MHTVIHYNILFYNNSKKKKKNPLREVQLIHTLESYAVF